MTHPSASRWARLPLAAGTALLLTVTLPASAWPATGTVDVGVTYPSGEGTNVKVPNPKDGHCYTVREVAPNAPQGSHFAAVGNDTDKAFHLYSNDTCSGGEAHPAVEAHKNLIGVTFKSFKLG